MRILNHAIIPLELDKLANKIKLEPSRLQKFVDRVLDRLYI